MLFWIVVAVLALLVLGGYALYLHRQVKGREKQQAIWRAELDDYVDERRSHMANSIAIIANAMVEGQMTAAECCLRISNLLRKLGDVAEQERFVVIHKVASAVSHIPILEEWKALKFKQRMMHLKEMDIIENQYRELVVDSCMRIKTEGIDKKLNTGSVSTAVGIYHPQ